MNKYNFHLVSSKYYSSIIHRDNMIGKIYATAMKEEWSQKKIQFIQVASTNVVLPFYDV